MKPFSSPLFAALLLAVTLPALAAPRAAIDPATYAAALADLQPVTDLDGVTLCSVSDYYARRSGVSKNDLKALEWYRNAAKSGSKKAQQFVAERMTLFILERGRDGRVVPATLSLEEALGWAIAAEKKGNDTQKVQAAIARALGPEGVAQAQPVVDSITTRY